ncbi:hypothetical protein Gohar_012956, partial [Gossypium harknessii]|nr:hypothetical protein [Gossypium harknessii]
MGMVICVGPLGTMGDKKNIHGFGDGVDRGSKRMRWRSYVDDVVMNEQQGDRASFTDIFTLSGDDIIPKEGYVITRAREDYTNALSKGPCIYGHYLTIQPWIKAFTAILQLGMTDWFDLGWINMFGLDYLDNYCLMQIVMTPETLVYDMGMAMELGVGKILISCLAGRFSLKLRQYDCLQIQYMLGGCLFWGQELSRSIFNCNSLQDFDGVELATTRVGLRERLQTNKEKVGDDLQGFLHVQYAELKLKLCFMFSKI